MHYRELERLFEGFRSWTGTMDADDIKKIMLNHGLEPDLFDDNELVMGYEVELEHGSEMGDETNVTKDDPWKTIQIVLAHLKELPDYYTKLKEMEGESL